jgi:hypothetical protein
MWMSASPCLLADKDELAVKCAELTDGFAAADGRHNAHVKVGWCRLTL